MGLKNNKGFSLVEVVIAAAIFSIVALAIYQGFVSITLLVGASRDKVATADLINSEFELVRNLSFEDVGVIAGIPAGVLEPLSTVQIDGREFEVRRVVRNVDDPFDGTIGGSPNDLSPADYKMVQIEVVCANCKNQIDYRAQANIAPKNLETASTNGALFVRVYDANGDPVPQANVNIQNAGLGININETTDNNGVLQVVDAPPAENSYKIIVTKSGYTEDRTYSPTVANPNPAKPDATVLLQQLTQISFIIDRESTLNLKTMTKTCAPVSGVPVAVRGTKLIGTSPDVFKWTGNFTTDSGGLVSVPDLEWDVFTFSISGGYFLAGLNPLAPLSVLPGSEQNMSLVVAQDPPPHLLVSVKDSATMLPISGATVRLSDGALFEEIQVTDQGYFRQTDWSGGSGQLNFGDETKYYFSDGNIETGSPVGELKLVNLLGDYVPSGTLTSSVFNAGSAANWSKAEIFPVDQPVETGAQSLRFQIATSEDNTTETIWEYKGPDGTSGTYYTATDNNINPIHNGHRYFRYRIFLSTADSTFTPNISDFILTYSSSCIPPGQVVFSDLSASQHNLEVSAPGYVTQNINNVSTSANWQEKEILLAP